jgi:hypothetical protein
MDYKKKYIKYKTKYLNLKSSNFSGINEISEGNKVNKSKYINLKNGGSSIPKIIHLIWFGDKPSYLEDKINKWLDNNLKYQVWLWTNKKYFNYELDINTDRFHIKPIEEWLTDLKIKEIINLWLDLPLNKWGRMKYAATSDIARIAILYEYGGLYSDIDNEPEKIPNNWENQEFYLLGTDESFFPALLGSIKENMLFQIALDIIKNIDYKFINELYDKNKKEKWTCIGEFIGIVLNESFNIYKLANPLLKDRNEYTIYFDDDTTFNKYSSSKIIIGSDLSREIDTGKCEYVEDFYNTINFIRDKYKTT